MTIDTRKFKLNLRTTYKVIGNSIEIEIKFLSINFITFHVKTDLFIKFFKDMESIYKEVNDGSTNKADNNQK